jgi:hypothetical protein
MELVTDMSREVVPDEDVYVADMGHILAVPVLALWARKSQGR